MDSQRQAAWESAIVRNSQGEEVPREEHYALVREDLFRGMNKAAAHEEAMYVVRYWLAGLHPSRIPWRGPSEADNWFALRETWGEERQLEKLRNMIDVSDRPDYWEALNLIAARLHDKRQRFPDELADWASQVHRGKIPRPKKRQSNKGQPPYANDVRNFSYADAFDLLGFLGLTAKMARYAAIAAACRVDERTVSDAIKAYGQSDGRIPAPWECWPLKP